MTDEVAERVLRNNYLQTLCLSLASAAGTEETGFEILLMQSLEERGLLDRKLEFLPSDAAVIERDAKGGGLTRPELSVLMAYAKLALNADLLAGRVPDDAYLGRDLLRYFPARMRDRFAPEIAAHRLRREIIATMLANSMINRGGPSFVTRLVTETGAQVADIAAAFAVARDSFDFVELNGNVDALDAKIDGQLQLELYLDLHKQLRWATIWFLRNEKLNDGLAALVSLYKQGIDEVRGLLPGVLPERDAAALKERMDALVSTGISLPTAGRLAAGRLLIRAMDIVRIAGRTGADHHLVAATVYGSASILGIERLAREAGKLFAKDFVERRAINRLTSQIFQTHRAIATRIVEEAKAQGVDWLTWLDRRGSALNRTAAAIEPLLSEKSFDLARLAVAQGMLADLSNV
jgi:glutamate dehydrogenase